MNKYFTIILVLILIYRLYIVENFEELYLSNYAKLKLDNEIRIIIDNIKLIFENNSYFSSKFKCDQFLLLLDSLIEDYNSINLNNVYKLNSIDEKVIKKLCKETYVKESV